MTALKALRVKADPITATLADLDTLAEMQRGAEACIERSIDMLADNYRRERDLPKLMRVDPSYSTAEIIERLERALAANQTMLSSGHWCASRTTCINIRAALRAERRALLRRAA